MAGQISRGKPKASPGSVRDRKMREEQMLGGRQRAVRSGTHASTVDFNVKTLKALQTDLDTGRIPLERIVLSDPIQIGLRAIVRKAGVTLHAHYEVGGARPMIKLGEIDEISIEEARKLTAVIRDLGLRGIDVQEGMHERLIRELRKEGAKWRPHAER